MIFAKVKKFISVLVSAILIISAFPAMAAPIGDELYGKISETVIIDTNSNKMIKYGRVENLTKNNIGTPYYADEILVVPIRFLSETFHGLIEFDEVSRECRVSFERGQINYAVGSKTASLYDEDFELSLAPFLKDGVTYVPLIDFITVLKMGYVTGDNGMLVISPMNDIDKSYFTHVVFDKLHELMYAQAVEEVTVYVSITGSADGDGTKENPFNSIYTAKDYVRELKKDGIERKITVVFEEGTYSLDRSVEFETADSGTAANPIVYSAAPGANVKFTSGYTLDTWEQYDENIWRVQLPEKKSDCWIVTDGEHMGEKAKYPNEGFLEAIADIGGAKNKSFRYDELPELEKNNDLQVGFFPGGASGAWMWTWWHRYVEDFDTENKRIALVEGTFNGSTGYALGTGSKYIMYNALEFIDIPGELYYNTAQNYLYYYPHDASKINEVIIPRAIDMFKFNGTSKDEPVRNIELRDIHFDGVDFYGEEYYTDMFYNNAHHEPDVSGTAVKLINTSAIHIEGCKFTNAAYDCINSFSNAIGTHISNSYFENIGGTLYGVSKYSTIENCYAKNTSHVILTDYGIYVNGSYAHIANNRITKMRRSAIEVDGSNVGSVIEFNELDQCMYMSQDGASIYIEGNIGGVQRNNICRDIDSRYGVMTAMYLDDRTRDFKSYNNTTYNMNLEFSHPDEQMAGLSQKSQRNYVYNNVFADLNSAQGNTFNKQSWDTIEHHRNYNNVWYNCYDRVRMKFDLYSTTNFHDKLFLKLGGNMFYNDAGVYTWNVRGVENMETIQNIGDGDLGHKELVGVKPEFMNPEMRDYRMRYDSMAYAQGFRDFNISDIGLKEDFKWGPEEKVVDRIHVKEKNSFVDNATVLLSSGQSKQLEITARETKMQMKFTPDSKNISYISENPEIVSVTNDGVITGIAPGKAHVTAVYFDGEVQKTSDLYVFVDDFAVTEYISPENTTEIYVAESENFGTVAFVYAKTKYGRVLELNPDKHRFTSADENTAIAKENGKIIGRTQGDTEVTLSSLVPQAVVAPYKIKVRTVKDFYSNLQGNIDSSFLKLGEKVHITTVATAKRNSLVENIPAKLTSKDESIVKILQEDGQYYVEAVGVGSTVLNAIYDAVPGNEMSKKISVSVVDGENSSLSGFIFGEMNGLAMDNGIKSVNEGHISFYSNGEDVYGANDSCTYIYKESEGNTEIIATLDKIENPVDISTSIGPMFRISNDTSSNMIQFRTRRDGTLLMVWRDDKTPTCSHAMSEKFEFPITVKLTREGNVFTGYALVEGSWKKLLTKELEMPKKVYAGISAFSHSETKTSDFEISNVAINKIGGTVE